MWMALIWRSYDWNISMFPVLGICVGGRMISSRIKTRNLISLGRLKFGLPSWKLTRNPRNGSGWLRNIMFLQAEPVLEMAVCDLLCKIIMASYHEKLWYSCAVVIVFSIYIYIIFIYSTFVALIIIDLFEPLLTFPTSLVYPVYSALPVGVIADQ